MIWNQPIFRETPPLFKGAINTSFWGCFGEERGWREKLEKLKKILVKHKKDQELKMEDSQ